MAKAKRYELDEAVLGEQKFKGQAALIVRSLLDKHPQTVQEIADEIKAKLQTRQDPIRVVSFYISTWKKSGLITVASDEAPTVAAEAPVSTGPSDLEEEAPAIERELEDLETEPSASAPEQRFDYVNAPLSDAVLEVLTVTFADPATPKMVSDELNVLGRAVTSEQVRGTIRRLTEKGHLVKLGDGRYGAASREHA